MTNEGDVNEIRRRRGHGEGSFRRRDDGRWEVRVDLGWSDGRRVRRSFYGNTRAEVAKKLQEVQRQVQSQSPIPDGRTRLGDFLDRWLEEVVKPTRDRATWSGYEVNVRRHIQPKLGHVKLALLGPANIQALLNAKREEGLAPRTVQYVHATLRAALAVAVRWGLVGRNAAIGVSAGAVDREPVQPFSVDEAHQILAAAVEHRLAAFFRVAMSIGLRPSEALGLTWDDIDLDARMLHVRKALDRRRANDFEFKKPKSRRSRRSIPLPDVCVQALVRHHRRQSEERLSAGETWTDHDLVFTTRSGGPLDRSQVSRQFTDLLKRAGVAHRRLYDCRHTAASLLLVQGV